MVGRSIGPHKPASVEAEHHVEVLKSHVVDDLVVRPLHERGVDVAERHESSRGHARAERHRVLLGNAHIKRPVGHLFHHELQAASAGHGWGHANNAAVLLGQLDDAVSKDILELRGLGGGVGRLENLPSHLVEQPWGVPLGGASRLRRRVAGTLAGDHVQQLGTWDVLDVFKHFGQVLHVVTVHRTEVAEVE